MTRVVQPTSTGRLSERLPALVALALPVLLGMVCMALLGAPTGYLAANGAALAIGAALVLALRAPASLRNERIVAGTLLALLFVPLITGPAVNGIARWLPLGPLALHAGMLALPALVVLAARDAERTPLWLAGALLAASLQPDAASAFAVTIAAVGIYQARPDWKLGVVALLGFAAMIVAALRGELPAQPFVERVLVQYGHESPAAALALLAALVASFALLASAAPLERPARFALAGSLFGFSAMALMSNYPSALIGHGAAPIIGYGLALGLVRPTKAG